MKEITLTIKSDDILEIIINGESEKYRAIIATDDFFVKKILGVSVSSNNQIEINHLKKVI